MATFLQPGSRIRTGLIALASLAGIAAILRVFVFEDFRVTKFLCWAIIGMAVWALHAARSGYDPRSAEFDASVSRGSQLWRSVGPRMRYDFIAFKTMLTLVVLILLSAAFEPAVVEGSSSILGAITGAIFYDALRP